MTLRPSTRLGPYELHALLGKGGMGEVYLARDTRLDRDVAIKVLPKALAGDPERIARFEREAKVLATLAHPNIAAVHGLERHDNTTLLAMELAAGQTLAERLRVGPLPVDEALDVARQIALALEAAHEQGIIHRDIKPANVKISSENMVKVLDFGLAKALAVPEPVTGSDLANSPTITAEFTRPGVVMGTAAYMSPEQARGKSVDKRTDIWSFGCVLYECLTGRAAFDGETVTDLLASILQAEPGFGALPKNTPPTVVRILQRCLEKDPRRRLRDIGDVAIELDEAVRDRAWTTTAIQAAALAPLKSRRGSGGRLAAVLFLLLLGCLAGVFLGHFSRSRAPRPVLRMSVTFPPELKAWDPQLSPDGQTIAWLGRPRNADPNVDAERHIYTRRIDTYEHHKLRGTAGARAYCFSTDGSWIGFRAPVSPGMSQYQFAKVPADGSAPPLVLSTWAEGWDESAFLPSGDVLIIDSDDQRMLRIPAGGGSPYTENSLDLGNLSGGIGAIASLPSETAAIVATYAWEAGGYRNGLSVLDLASATIRPLVDVGGSARLASTGHILFSRGDTLLAAPFDSRRLELAGAATPVMSGIRTISNYDHGSFDLGDNGTLMYTPGGRVGAHRRLVLVGAAGKVEPWSEERRRFVADPAMSPDGKHVTITAADHTGKYEVWLGSTENPRLRQFAAFANADASNARWSPDGERMAFVRFGNNAEDGIYVGDLAGHSAPRLVLPRGDVPWLIVWSWVPDGSSLLVSRFTGGEGELLRVPVTPGAQRSPEVIGGTPRPMWSGYLSPDGRWLLYGSNDAGSDEVYICQVPKEGPCTGVPVSEEEGMPLGWSSDGRTAFFSRNQHVWAVALEAEPGLRFSPPREVVDLTKLDPLAWDVLPDGRVLAIQRGEDERDFTHVNVVLNWLEDVKHKLPSAER